MSAGYVEFHAKSFYSFGTGASHVHELLAQAGEYGYSDLALTDGNLCGALDFARLAGSLDIRPITGGELTLTDGSRIVLLTKTRQGYTNTSRLFTLANAHDRREPRLSPAHLPEHAGGVILLTGGRDGPLSRLLAEGCRKEARRLLNDYREWFGPEGTYVELQQNLLRGDTQRNRELAALACEVGAPIVATNDVLYHRPERCRLQHALVAARRNTTIEQALPYIQPNHHLCLKPPAEMAALFREYPGAIANTVRIAEQCDFNLADDLGYTLPDAAVPEGYTPSSYLERLCLEAAQRRYGAVSRQVRERLAEEFQLIDRHGLAGFLLLYREIVMLAQEIMEEKGLAHPEIPLEERPPGRGRGSSVALLVGYLTGISHVDPLRWGLTLERFISEDTSLLPDIDLDFPRALRDELIGRVHQRFGPEHAVLAGAVSTYSAKGIVQDLGKALGLPKEDLKRLSRQLSRDGAKLRDEMLALPDFRDRVDAPGWRELADLAPQLMHAPRSLGQHVGGMVLSSEPLPELVPIRAGATPGRYIMDWNKDSVADANFAKIDLLSLPVLDQLEEALDLIEAKQGRRPDLGRVSPNDPSVYDMINQGKSKGVFLLQSPAQLKMAQRLKSRNLLDLAYQVALIRPGVGVQGSAVSQFVERYRHGAAWEYDHPLEKRALERGYGIIVWQEQVVQLIGDVAGMTAAQADEIRRAFARPNNDHLIARHRARFLEGTGEKGVPKDAAERIFAKINGQYMFPESHSHAFAVTAYQAAWLKRYHPLEFFVALINQKPMGFYPVETLKQDARRFGVPFLNPCVNRGGVDCIPYDDSLLLGLRFIKDVGAASAALIVSEREGHGPYAGPADLVRRTGLKPQGVESLVMAGAFDTLTPNRRQALWDVGLGIRPGRNGQRAFAGAVNGDVPNIPDFTADEKMAGEYRVLGIYPNGHLMEFVRPSLGADVLPAAAVDRAAEGAEILVAGWPIARQHPRGEDSTVFVTIEDETGDAQVILWPQAFRENRRQLGSQVLVVRGTVSRWDGTANVIASDVRGIHPHVPMPASHDWR
ncbi:MAG: DNA polymerase III subunit alpha [Chloroflexi bacterium]|nr:DNA polymerase III subunit alpha [Chloroflexota bacterium]MYD49274.1 DNA polymerase III subunit alpha [Chloroflexota bacterium]